MPPAVQIAPTTSTGGAERAKIHDDGVTIYAELTGKDHEAQRHEHKSKGWFSVDDLAYAERLEKAIRHAVELCGGKTSKF